jgi:hypothetical protein
MSNAAPAPKYSSPLAADEAPDPSIARAERRLRLLEELAEIGMELARALRPCAQTGEAAPDEAPGKDPAEAFAPLSRAIRLTLALEAKTDAALRDLKAGIVRERAEARERIAKTARENCVNRVRDLVLSVADVECDDFDAHDNLFEALNERLEQDEAYEKCHERPLRETVERLCKDLKLTPDWSRWAGEGWVDDGPPIRPRYSPFNQPSRRPVLTAGEPPPLTPIGDFQPARRLE